MLQVKSVHRLNEMEVVLRVATQRHGGRVLAVTHLGQLLRDKGLSTHRDALVFTLCQQELYAPLLAADVRFAAFLPARVAACQDGDGVTLEALNPEDCCHLLDRPDLLELAAPLRSALLAIMGDAARIESVSLATRAGVRHSGLGATEEQVNARASLPQRIDCHGTKIEDLGGTGAHDSPGG
jgi:uncharacterized protein (DUF302 family)